MVLKIFEKEFLLEEFPQYFHFEGMGKSRQKLYLHFANNIKKYIPNYHFVQIVDRDIYLFKADFYG